MLWGGAVDLLQLIALFLPLTTICSHIKNKQGERPVAHLRVATFTYKTLHIKILAPVRGTRLHITSLNSAVPPRSPSVKMLRKERELQSTPL